MDKIITLLAVALGWLLNELSTLLRLRREDRRAAGPVLTDLLEIRHRLVALDAVVAELGKRFEVPPQGRLLLQRFLQTLIPEAPKFVETYEAAVSTLARVDPIIAFRVRGQPWIAPLLARLRALAACGKSRRIDCRWPG